MGTVMKDTVLVSKVKDVALNYKTLYVYGCFGAPLNATNKKRYTSNYPYNARADRKAMIMAASYDTFGWDCVNLIKGILWGWCGDLNKTYGGAIYASNGVPDTNADGMFNNYCYDKSNDFSNVKPGEFVWMKGHIGVAIGNGLAVECTPAWANKVQITAMNCSKSGYKTRNWTSHGKSVFIEYTVQPTPPTPTPTKYQIGDKVVVNGQLFGSADGSNPGKIVSGVVTNITRIAEGKPYPYNTTGDLGWVAESSLTPYTPSETFPFTGLIKKGTTLYKENGSPYPNKTFYDRTVEVLGENGDLYKVYGKTFKPNIVYVKKSDVTKKSTGAVNKTLNVGDTVKIVSTGYSNAYGTKGHTAYGVGMTRKIIRIYSGKAYPYQVGEGNVTIGFYKENALEKK